MAMMTLDLGGEPFLVDEETFTAIRKAESARGEYIESMMSDEDDEDEEFEDEDDYPISTVSPMSTMKSIVWLNDSQYARVDSQDALDLYDDEVLEAFVGDDGEVQFMTPSYALELAEGNQIRVDSEGIWISTWRSDAKAKKTTCGRGWIMGPGGKCVRNNKAGQGAVKVGQESASLKKLGQSNLGEAASSRLQALRAKHGLASSGIAENMKARPRGNKKDREAFRKRKQRSETPPVVRAAKFNAIRNQELAENKLKKEVAGLNRLGSSNLSTRSSNRLQEMRRNAAKGRSAKKSPVDQELSDLLASTPSTPSKRQMEEDAKELRDLDDLLSAKPKKSASAKEARNAIAKFPRKKRS